MRKSVARTSVFFNLCYSADQIEGSARKRKRWPDEDVETPQRRTRLQALRNPSPEKPPVVDQSDTAAATNDEQRGGNTEADTAQSVDNEMSDSAFDVPNLVSTSQAPFAAKPTSVESFRVYRANSAEIGSDVEASDKDDEDEENDDEESSGSDDSASESADENNEEDTESLTRGRSRRGSGIFCVSFSYLLFSCRGSISSDRLVY